MPQQRQIRDTRITGAFAGLVMLLASTSCVQDAYLKSLKEDAELEVEFEGTEITVRVGHLKVLFQLDLSPSYMRRIRYKLEKQCKIALDEVTLPRHTRFTKLASGCFPDDIRCELTVECSTVNFPTSVRDFKRTAVNATGQELPMPELNLDES